MKISPKHNIEEGADRLETLRMIAYSKQQKKVDWGGYEHGATNGLLFAIGIMEGKKMVIGETPTKVTLWNMKLGWLLMGMIFGGAAALLIDLWLAR